MDTLVSVRVDGQKEIISACRQLLSGLEDELSSHVEGGQIEKYNTSESGCVLTDNALELIGVSQKITEGTSGAFSVFSGGLVSLWSESAVLPDGEQIRNALAGVCFSPETDGSYLKRSNSITKLELGGIAKGYACDKAVALMKEMGAESGMISFSSSIGVFGTNPDGAAWRIAVKDPFDTQRNIGIISLSEGFLSVSGDYERWYTIDGKEYNHIIDLKSGMPVDNGVHSVVVIAPNGAESDGLSTAFFAMGCEAASAYAEGRDIKYLFITDDGVFMNEGMKEIFKELS